MAARKIRVRHDEAAREAIRTTQLVKRLRDHALADDEIMTNSQVNAARILLNKTLPDLQAVSLTGPDGGAVQVQDITRLKEAEALLRQHGIDPDEIE